MKSKYVLAVAAAAMLMLTACGESEDSSSANKQSAADSVSSAEDSGVSSGDDSESGDNELSGGEYEVPETLKNAADGYDPEGETRMYDVLKEEFGGDFYLETTSNGASLMFNVKGERFSASTVYNGMMSRVYYLEDKTFYNVSDATTTYVRYDDYDYDIRNSDPIFGGTGEFDSAEINADGNIAETYKLDSNFAGEGTICYIFNSETGALMNFDIDLNGASALYVVDSLSNADETLMELPDLSAYNQNGGSAESDVLDSDDVSADESGEN